jgi:hypothetical protein
MGIVAFLAAPQPGTQLLGVYVASRLGPFGEIVGDELDYELWAIKGEDQGEGVPNLGRSLARRGFGHLGIAIAMCPEFKCSAVVRLITEA